MDQFSSLKMASFQSPPPGKVKPLSPFVSKLKLLLSDSKYQEAIRWSSNGAAIVIFDADTFKRIVLEKTAEMFKTKNFTSFVRQLNLYGFRKVPTNGKCDPNKNMKFEHPHFVQSKPEMMHLVQRTCSSTKKRRTDDMLGHFYDESDKMFPSYPKDGKTPESHALEKAAWLSNYYERASTKTALSVNSSNRQEEVATFQADENFDKDEHLTLEYMYQKLQEEHHAVQLLMHLKYSSPNPEVFPAGMWEPQIHQCHSNYPVSLVSQPLSNTRPCHCSTCVGEVGSSYTTRAD